MQPCGRVFRRRRVETVEIDEDFLGHVLRLMRIGEDAIRYPDDAAVFGCEKGLERLVFRPDGGHPARTEVHAHYPSSTARCRFVTALAPEVEAIRPAQAGHQPARALRRRELRAISSSTIAKSVLGRAWIWPWKASVQCSGGHLRT